MHPFIHVSEFESYFKDHFGRIQKPPPLIIKNDEEEYEGEKNY